MTARRLVRTLSIACLALALLGQSGCTGVLLLGYLFGGPPMKEPDFHVETKQRLDGKDTRVLVYCFAPTALKWDNDAIDHELAKFVSYRLVQHKINVIDPDLVHAWLDKNPEWVKETEMGAELKADYIVKVDLTDFSLYEENSHDLFRGRTDAIITVIKMDEERKDGEAIYNKPIVSRFPRQGPVSIYQYSFPEFKKRYLTALSDEIGVLFYESAAGDDFVNTAL